MQDSTNFFGYSANSTGYSTNFSSDSTNSAIYSANFSNYAIKTLITKTLHQAQYIPALTDQRLILLIPLFIIESSTKNISAHIHSSCSSLVRVQHRNPVPLLPQQSRPHNPAPAIKYRQPDFCISYQCLKANLLQLNLHPVNDPLPA